MPHSHERSRLWSWMRYTPNDAPESNVSALRGLTRRFAKNRKNPQEEMSCGSAFFSAKKLFHPGARWNSSAWLGAHRHAAVMNACMARNSAPCIAAFVVARLGNFRKYAPSMYR